MTNANTQISLAEDTVIPLGEACIEGVTYIPQVTMLDAGLKDEEVSTIIRIKVSISQGVDAFIDMTTYHALEFVADPTAKQICFRETRDPDIAYSIDASAGVDMTKEDVERVTAIVDAVIQTYVELSSSC
jgi:predicted TIM-barrel enzyme